MLKTPRRVNKTQSKWCINKHGASKIIDTFETYQCSPEDPMILLLLHAPALQLSYNMRKKARQSQDLVKEDQLSKLTQHNLLSYRPSQKAITKTNTLRLAT
jgi:hypothetical protein